MENRTPPSPFPGVQLHKSEVSEEPAFLGVAFHNVQVNPKYIEEKATQKKEEVKELIPFPHSGYKCSRGRRKTMEDKHINIDSYLYLTPDEKVISIAYYGVYDGRNSNIKITFIIFF